MAETRPTPEAFTIQSGRSSTVAPSRSAIVAVPALHAQQPSRRSCEDVPCADTPREPRRLAAALGGDGVPNERAGAARNDVARARGRPAARSLRPRAEASRRRRASRIPGALPRRRDGESCAKARARRACRAPESRRTARRRRALRGKRPRRERTCTVPRWPHPFSATNTSRAVRPDPIDEHVTADAAIIEAPGVVDVARMKANLEWKKLVVWRRIAGCQYDGSGVEASRPRRTRRRNRSRSPRAIVSNAIADVREPDRSQALAVRSHRRTRRRAGARENRSDAPREPSQRTK